MKCHVCNGEHTYLCDKDGTIRQWMKCPHCEGTGEEPFNAQAELAELNRRVAALEKSKPTPPERPHVGLQSLARASVGCGDISRTEASAIWLYVAALEKECGK